MENMSTSALTNGEPSVGRARLQVDLHPRASPVQCPPASLMMLPRFHAAAYAVSGQVGEVG